MPEKPPADLLKLNRQLEANRIELELRSEELRRALQELSVLQQQYKDLTESAPCGYLTLNAKGVIIRANPAGVVLVDEKRQGILRAGFSQFVSPDCHGSYFGALQRTRQTGEKQSLELKLGGTLGKSGWVWMEIQADLEESGEATRFRLTLVDISAKKAQIFPLTESENPYEHLFREMACGVVLLEIAELGPRGLIVDTRIVEVNPAFARLTGVPPGQAVGNTLRRLWPEPGKVWLTAIDRAVRTGRPVEAEVFHRDLGKQFLMSAFHLGSDRIGATFVDVSVRKLREEKLDKAYRDLGIVVRERSTELRQARLEVRKAAEACEVAEGALLEKSGQLDKQLVELGEAHAAIQGLLKERGTERSRLEEEVVCNINELVRPPLARLASGNLNKRQRNLLDAIGRSLDEIASPLSRRFIIEGRRLTPAETQVADLIRQGKSTKEIAAHMGVASSTIDYHRLNIRRRLGLTDRQTNLQSYLRSLL